MRASLSQGQVIWAMGSGDLPVQGLGTVAASHGCPVHGPERGTKGQRQHCLPSVTAAWSEPVRAVGSAEGLQASLGLGQGDISP